MSASPITVARSSFNGGEISPSLGVRIELDKYNSSCKKMENFIPHPHGGASNRSGFEFIDETKDSAHKSILVPFQFSVVQSYMLLFSAGFIRFYKDGGFIETSSGSGVHYEVTTPYTEDDLPKLKFEQSADILYITHPSYQTKLLSRTGHTSWTLTDAPWGAGQNPPTGVTASGTTYTYGVTAVNADEIESIPGTHTADRGNTLSWTAPSGTAPAYYNIYEQVSGTWAFIGKAEGSTSFVIPSSPSRNTDITPPKQVTVFDAAGKYPGVSAFFDQRLIFARSDNKPQTLWGSRVSDFYNMNYSSPVQDDDAFNFTINSTQVNEIRWIVALTQCLIGTSGGEWVMRPGGNNATITPTSVDIKPQSRWGCADLRPIVVGNSVVFVEGSRKNVRNLAYSLELDGYDGSNLTILAQHIFKDYGITSWCYQQYPDSIIWAVREDGTLCGLTYMVEHKLVGWHRHITDGAFESVACISTAPGVNEVWAVVKRFIDGQTKRYVERLTKRNFTNIEDAFFVDSGLKVVSETAGTHVGNLGHLEGEQVIVLADGNVEEGHVVTGGAITLNHAAKTVIVGLPYICDMETTDFTAATQMGEIAYKTRKLKGVKVYVENTREVFIGSSADKLSEVKFRSTENYGSAVQPFTGLKDKISVAPGDGTTSSVFVRVKNPVPCTIQSIIALVDYGDK